MDRISDQTLYQDQFYVILQNDEREIITLIMPARRMALEFTFDEWQELRSIVSGIEIPVCAIDECVFLYEDDIHLFKSRDGAIEWNIGDRMIAITWDCAAWAKFRAMMAAVGHVPWTVI